MVSIANPSFDILARNGELDAQDYVLFPDSNAQSLYAGELCNMNNMQNLNLGLADGSAQYTLASYHHGAIYTDAPAAQYTTAASTSPSPNPFVLSSPELRAPPSNYSTASGPSANSSTMGSPHTQPLNSADWTPQMAGELNHHMVKFDTAYTHDFQFGVAPPLDHTGMDELAFDQELAGQKHNGLVDPSLINAAFAPRPMATPVSNDAYNPQWMFAQPTSPTPSHHSSYSSNAIKQDSQSPYPAAYAQPYPYQSRRPSLVSQGSINSGDGSFISSPEQQPSTSQKGRCNYPDCGKVFKDLKAHQLTHQASRPEKCPITTCEYHIKGFARKYDKNRHTLTHYKGTMVCGFCPGSGSAAEKSFNRADVFKRHLTSVHGVEQTPPNSRKKSAGSSSSLSAKRGLAGYAPDATGKCSTCSQTFSNAQDFYEHLDDCVLRIVQQEDPSEAVNAKRLQEVENDAAVHETLASHDLPTTTTNSSSFEVDDDDEEDEDDADEDYTLRAKSGKSGKGSLKSATRNSEGKSRGLTHSRGGVTIHTKGRKKRKDYPSSWGCNANQMKMKKRVLCVFDGPRRLWKDDLMLGTDYEVRLKLQNGGTGIGGQERYITDLDVQTLRRAEAFHNATEEEKGAWVSDDLSGMDLDQLLSGDETAASLM